MFDITILTEDRYLDPLKKNWYTEQVLLEDEILFESLRKRGLVVTRKSWSDKNFDWSNTNFAIIRSTWDYFDKIDEFSQWLTNVKDKLVLINSFNLIKWNLNKSYLLDFSKKKINIASSIFINSKNFTTLKKLFNQTNWDEAIIKPAISGAAKNTIRVNKENCDDFESIFRKLCDKVTMIFQIFLKSIISFGEISLMVFGGEYSHSVRKIAKEGDFRVQDDHGGRVEKYIPSLNEIRFAEKCVSECIELPLYARVDLIYDNENNLSLSEIELIEPELWFRLKDGSEDLLSEKIMLEIGKKNCE